MKSKTTNQDEGTRKEIKKKSVLKENIEAIIIALILAFFIRTFIVQAFKIPSGSMKETLQIGDHILVNKFIYGVKIPFLRTTLIDIKNPKRFDIVVFKFPEDPKKDFIKRVIGVEGDTVEIRNKKVYINNEQIDDIYGQYTDPYEFPANSQPRDNFGPVKVPAHSIFVMGDNRDHSYDSRWWGFVDLKALEGKAMIIYWSWDGDNFGVRWNRIGQILK